MATKRRDKVNPRDQVPDYLATLKRGWSLVVYDIQGGPIPEDAVNKLDSFAQEVAKEFNLAITTTVE